MEKKVSFCICLLNISMMSTWLAHWFWCLHDDSQSHLQCLTWKFNMSKMRPSWEERQRNEQIEIGTKSRWVAEGTHRVGQHPWREIDRSRPFVCTEQITVDSLVLEMETEIKKEERGVGNGPKWIWGQVGNWCLDLQSQVPCDQKSRDCPIWSLAVISSRLHGPQGLTATMPSSSGTKWPGLPTARENKVH